MFLPSSVNPSGTNMVTSVVQSPSRVIVVPAVVKVQAVAAEAMPVFRAMPAVTIVIIATLRIAIKNLDFNFSASFLLNRRHSRICELLTT